MPTILVKCVNSYTGAQRIDCIEYHETYIAQIFGVVFSALCLWAVIISTTPVTASLLLSYLVLSNVRRVFLELATFDSLSDDQYHEVLKVNDSLREMMLQAYLPRYQDNFANMPRGTLRKLRRQYMTCSFWRHQFHENDYKQLIANFNDENMDLVWIKKSTD